MYRIVCFTRTNNDKWMYELRYKEFKNSKEFIEWSKEDLIASNCDDYYRSYYVIENKKLTKILVIHEGVYCTL